MPAGRAGSMADMEDLSARRHRPRRARTTTLGALVLLLVAPAGPTGAGATPAGAKSSGPRSSGVVAAEAGDAVPRGPWQWPLAPDPPVLRRFDRPTARWAAGHRGVDLAARGGQEVRAPASGRVVFAGVVVDRPVISVLHEGGARSTFEPAVASRAVGEAVAAGEVLGRLAEGAGHCAPGPCLHWGVRLGSGRAAVYLDPLLLVAPRGPSVLIPVRHGP